MTIKERITIGKKIEPFYIERIIDKNGKELILENEDVSKASIARWYGKQIPKEETYAIDPRVSFLVNDILREATQRGTGKAIKKLERDDFAGKTGTTNDSESAWFTGFNNKILTTVWFGYDQPRSLGTNEYGSTTALPIWLNFMEEIIDSIEYSIPAVPSNLIAKKINLSTGKEANSLDDNARFEYFFD